MKLFIISVSSFLLLGISVITQAGEMKIMQVSPKVRLEGEEKVVGGSNKIDINKIQFLDNKGNLVKEIECGQNKWVKLSPDKKKIVISKGARRKYSNEAEIKKILKQAHETKDKEKYEDAYKEVYKLVEEVDLYDEDSNLVKTFSIQFLINELFVNNQSWMVIKGVVNVRGTTFGSKLAFYDPNGNSVRIIDSNEAKEKKIAIEGWGRFYQNDKFLYIGSFYDAKGGAITLFDLKGNIIWEYSDKNLEIGKSDISFSQDGEQLYVYARYYDYKNPPIEKTWILDKAGNLLKILDGWGHEAE